jgi:hypothetical protein
MSCHWTAAKGVLRDETKVEKTICYVQLVFGTIFHPTHYP